MDREHDNSAHSPPFPAADGRRLAAAVLAVPRSQNLAAETPAAAHSAPVTPAPENRRLDLFLLAIPGRAAAADRTVHRPGRRDGIRRRGNPARADASDGQRLPAAAQTAGAAATASICAACPRIQGFVTPDKDKRQENIDHTLQCIEIAYAWASPRSA